MLKVDTLISADVQLPYAYYSVPFCRPNATFDSAGYFGEFLGHQYQDSPYVISTTIVLLKRYLEQLVQTIVSAE